MYVQYMPNINYICFKYMLSIVYVFMHWGYSLPWKGTKNAGWYDYALINSQSLEHTQVGYISQKYTWNKYTLEKISDL